MKSITIGLWLILISLESFSQSPERPKGNWQGSLHAGRDLRVVFHFSRDQNGQWTASFDSPDQYATGIACSDIMFVKDSVNLTIPSAKGRFKGIFLSDSIIKGEWIQTAKFDLTLKKTDKPAEVLRRKQTPGPPFPYAVEDLEYAGPKTGLKYGATLTIPEGKGPFPAVLLITGSGAQDRDESIFGHKPFAVLADFLTRKGVLVLRVDDRGVGKSTGDFAASTSADFADDVNAGIDFLKKQPNADPHKLGLIGHSEGGMIAPMVAANRKEIQFIILLAGPGEKISKLMEEQNAAVLISMGIKQDAVQAFQAFYPNLIGAVVDSKSAEEATEKMNLALDQWKKSTNKNYVLATTGVYNDSSQHNFVQSMVRTLYNPWFLYFLRYDPAPNLEKLQCMVLALNGEKDIQVVAGSNLAGIKKALENSGSKNFEVHELKGLNHLFQDCKKCTVQEYGQLEETFSPLALEMIAAWIDKNVK